MFPRAGQFLVSNGAVVYFTLTYTFLDTRRSRTTDVLSISTSNELCRYYSESPNSQGYQGAMPGLHRKDCNLNSSEMFSMKLNFVW